MRVGVIALLVAAAPLLASAHPIAQGTIEVAITGNTVELHARVSPEEVFVANEHAAAPTRTLEQAYSRHADYLRQHLRVFADNSELHAAATSYSTPKRGDPYAHYDFTFPIARQPAVLRLEQNVLNEIQYAPGNRWEATYLVTARDQRHSITNGELLTSGSPLVIALDSSSSWWRTAGDYLWHGINHILTGYDHLLFIAALALAVTSLWELFKIIAVFTLAHTITLTVSVLNIVRLPSQIVEPMIAASIVVVALQNVLSPKQSHGRVRLLVAFFFGLFHGLGFAGGLLDALSGMAGVSIGLAIVAFSLGVEIGHQCVVLPLFALGKLASRMGNDVAVRPWLLRGGSAVISAAGMFYLIAALTQAGGFHWTR